MITLIILITLVFKGYGEPKSSQYYSLDSQIPTLKFRDTFLDSQHLLESFPETVVLKSSDSAVVKKDSDPAVEEVQEINSQNPVELSFALGEAPDYPKLRELLNNTHDRLLAKANPNNSDNSTTPTVVPVPKFATQGGTTESEGSENKLNEYGEKIALKVKKDHIIAHPYNPVALKGVEVKRNTVRFTPMQIAAIKSGLNPGLTMVVGPPGTGKTDTAVQLISELYHNFPNERMVLVTHSNHALNDLFEKIMERDIPERYLLRLGRGSESLQSDKDFSKFGRVNHMLQRRMELLEEVKALAASFDMDDASAYSCEAASHFNLFHIISRWEQFQLALKNVDLNNTDSSKSIKASESSSGSSGSSSSSNSSNNMEIDDDNEVQNDAKDNKQGSGSGQVQNLFPFMSYFVQLAQRENRSPVLFLGESEAEDLKAAESYYKTLQVMFQELEETRPFELLRRNVDRGNYLLTKHAKVIAMTCK